MPTPKIPQGSMERAFWLILRAAQEEKRMSDRALARAVGVSHQTIARWFRGDIPATLTDAEAMAGALGLDLIGCVARAEREAERLLNPQLTDSGRGVVAGKESTAVRPKSNAENRQASRP